MKTQQQVKRARSIAAFTMVEIAICLAVIGFALVAIIGVLPIGMSVQKENREQTIINFEANYLLNLLRTGAQGQDNLTNFVNKICVTNYIYTYTATTPPQFSHYVWSLYTPTTNYVDGTRVTSLVLTNGANIVGLLTTPKYISLGTGTFESNTVTAVFRATTGSATDMGTNQNSEDFAFAYSMTVEVIPQASFGYAVPGQNFSAPLDAVTNIPGPTPWAGTAPAFAQANCHEIRLHFNWPILPNGTPGNANLTFRTAASGGITATTLPVRPNGVPLYFIGPQQYTTTVPSP